MTQHAEMELPKGWREVTVDCLKSSRDNALATGPFGSSIGAQFFQTSGVPIIRGNNLSSDGSTRLIDADFVFLSPLKAKEFHRSTVTRGDLIFTCWGTINQVGLIDDSAKYPAYVISNKQMKLTPDPGRADSLFLFYLFTSPAIQQSILNNSIGSSVPGFNLGQLRSMRLCVPPLPEQRAIAAALSDIDALIASLDRLIAKKRDLKQAAMQQLLTGKTRLPGFSGEWEVKSLGELGTTYGGLVGKTKADFGTGAARYIPFLNIMANVAINPSQLGHVRVDASERQNRAQEGDLFFNGSSETPEEVGMCSVLLFDLDDVYLNSFCFGFRLRDGVNANGLYLAYYFRSNEGRELVYSLAQGATRYNLSKTALLKLEIPLPQASEQRAIATVLSDMDAEITALEARREKTKLLKQGMMQELLTGRTRLV